MSDELALFGDATPVKAAPPLLAEDSVADWLIRDLRAALTAGGHISMAARKHAIEAAVGRPVESLRSLTRAEALRALTSLASTSTQQTSGASAWDERDEDTWIDRL